MKVYLIFTVLALVGGAYIMGHKIAGHKCTADVANNTTNEIIKTIYVQRKIDEKVYSTGSRDIRRILHDKYSIAE